MKIIAVLLLFLLGPVSAETVSVRLEPLPPLVVSADEGFTIDLLRAVESVSDFRFDIDVAPYSRAKYQLRNGQAALVGHIPVGLESARFYRYALELDWQVQAVADLFALDPALLTLESTDDIYIGVPLGNAAFFAELTGVPLTRFVEATLPNLVQMLAHGRIQVLIFERVSTRRAIRQARLTGVHYRHLQTIPAGLAVRNDARGADLRERLDAAIRQVDLDAIFGRYLREVGPHGEGVVSLP